MAELTFYAANVKTYPWPITCFWLIFNADTDLSVTGFRPQIPSHFA